MTSSNPRTRYGWTAFGGVLAVAALLGGGMAWASIAKISGAVIASGNVVVAGQPKSVQHLDGGLVSQIHVAPGDKVDADELLVVLDSTTIAANLAIYERRLKDALVERARLRSELENNPNIAAPSEQAMKWRLGDLSEPLIRQRTLMMARAETRQNEKAQYRKKIHQLENQISGVRGLGREKERQLIAYREEIRGIATLVNRGLAAKSRLYGLQRAEADLNGQIAEHLSELARLNNAIAEAKLARQRIDTVFQEKALEELKSAQATIDELTQQIDATRAQFNRVEIRAPVAGIVHELNLFTIGGVVQPGQTVMQIVPRGSIHELEVYVDPISIDDVGPGDEARIRFPAFNQRKTPELTGRVFTVSPASVVDDASGAAFYRVVVSLNEGELDRLAGKTLIPGMPVEAVIPTSERTVLSYLIKPLVDHFEHALREE